MKDQNFKIGDTLLCKKSNSAFVKGKSYIICDIDVHTLSIQNNKGYTYYIANNTQYLLAFSNIIVFYNCFYTNNEERKMKLERLNIL